MKNHCLFKEMLFRIKQIRGEHWEFSNLNVIQIPKKKETNIDNFIQICVDNVQWIKHDQKITRNIISSSLLYHKSSENSYLLF